MKKIIASILCLGVLFLFMGCSAQQSATGAEPAASQEAAMEAPAEAYSGSADYAVDNSYDYAEDTYTEKEIYDEEEGASASSGGFEIDTANIPDTNRKLVFSASFTIESTNYGEDYNNILNKLKECNGYVQSEDTNGTPPDVTDVIGRSSDLVLRVPIDNFEKFFTSISGVGKTMNQTRGTDDISGSYYDTEARIKLLEDRKDRLMGYLEEAVKPADIIAYEQELSDVLYELDQLQGSKRHMDDLVDYTTVSLYLYEVVEGSNIVFDEEGRPLNERAGDAFTKSATGVGRFLEDFAVGFAAAGPVLILVAVIVVIALLIIKLVSFLMKKYRAKHPKKEQQKNMRYPGYNGYPQNHVPPQQANQPPQSNGNNNQPQNKQ